MCCVRNTASVPTVVAIKHDIFHILFGILSFPIVLNMRHIDGILSEGEYLQVHVAKWQTSCNQANAGLTFVIVNKTYEKERSYKYAYNCCECVRVCDNQRVSQLA